MNQTVQTIRTAVGAGGTVANAFSGLRLAELPASFGSRFKVTIAVVCDVDDSTMTLYAGNRATPVHESVISTEGVAGRIVTRDDVVCSFLADAGEKLQLSLASTTGGDVTTRLIVQQVA